MYLLCHQNNWQHGHSYRNCVGNIKINCVSSSNLVYQGDTEAQLQTELLTVLFIMIGKNKMFLKCDYQIPAAYLREKIENSQIADYDES